MGAISQRVAIAFDKDQIAQAFVIGRDDHASTIGGQRGVAPDGAVGHLAVGAGATRAAAITAAASETRKEERERDERA